jgi:hypothetical protein
MDYSLVGGGRGLESFHEVELEGAVVRMLYLFIYSST